MKIGIIGTGAYGLSLAIAFSENNCDKGITPMQSFLMTLGSRIGVGSIAGVSLAIYLGGVGTIFWMWISALLASSNTFCETVLGIVYRRKDGTAYKGGPSYYIKYGLGNKLLGGIYALFIIASYVFGCSLNVRNFCYGVSTRFANQ